MFIQKNYSKEELALIFSEVEREKEEVIDLLKTEGGNIDEIVAKVRARTLKKQLDIIQEYKEKHGDTIDVDTLDNDNKK